MAKPLRSVINAMDTKPTNTRPGMEIMHRFRGRGSNVVGIKALGNGLIVLLERGPYWFATINSKPRKIKI